MIDKAAVTRHHPAIAALALAQALLMSACASKDYGETVILPKSPAARAKYDQERIDAIQNNASMPAQAKAIAIDQVRKANPDFAKKSVRP